MFTLGDKVAKSFATLGLILAIASGALASNHADRAFADIKIKNFGQMDDRFYRGGQPSVEDIDALAKHGIKTIIDLRDDSEKFELRAVEAAGMRYINIPMNGHDYPSPAQVSRFLSVVDDPGTGKFFAHCAGGRHRTGVMGAVYRFRYSKWNYDQVYSEMKSYDFYTFGGHGKLKDFVQDYWAQIQSVNSNRATIQGVK